MFHAQFNAGSPVPVQIGRAIKLEVVPEQKLKA